MIPSLPQNPAAHAVRRAPATDLLAAQPVRAIVDHSRRCEAFQSWRSSIGRRWSLYRGAGVGRSRSGTPRSWAWHRPGRWVELCWPISPGRPGPPLPGRRAADRHGHPRDPLLLHAARRPRDARHPAPDRDRVKIVAECDEAVPERLSALMAVPRLPGHRAQRVAAVSGKRAKRYRKREHLLEIARWPSST